MSRPSLRDGLEPGEPLPSSEGDNFHAALKTFAYGAGWAVAFELLHRSVPHLCGHLDWWKRLKEKDRYEARTYVTSFVHHAVAVPFSVWGLIRDAQNSGSLDLSYKAHRTFLPFTVGYFLADTWFARGQLLKSWDYTVHHAFGISLVWKAAAVRGAERFLPHFLVGEGTTLLLDVLWVLRKLREEDSQLYKVTGAAFTGLYALLRVWWYPFMTYHLYTDHRRVWDGLGPVAWSTTGVCALQVFWYIKILRKFAPVVAEALGTRTVAKAKVPSGDLPAAA